MTFTERLKFWLVCGAILILFLGTHCDKLRRSSFQDKFVVSWRGTLHCKTQIWWTRNPSRCRWNKYFIVWAWRSSNSNWCCTVIAQRRSMITAAAALYTTGALRITPMTALEALHDPIPIDIVIKTMKWILPPVLCTISTRMDKKWLQQWMPECYSILKTEDRSSVCKKLLKWPITPGGRGIMDKLDKVTPSCTVHITRIETSPCRVSILKE